MKLKSCRFANAVMVGNQELNFATDRHHDIELVSSTVIRVECRKSKDVSYSSLFNVPFWKMDETELELEAEGAPPVESVDIAVKGKKKK